MLNNDNKNSTGDADDYTQMHANAIMVIHSPVIHHHIAVKTQDAVFLLNYHQELVKYGDFRSLSGAAWHSIHSRFGTRLGPKPDGAGDPGIAWQTAGMAS